MSTLSRVVYDIDTTPPSVPGTVTATALSQTTIRIAWSPSTDVGGAGLAGYRVYRATTSGGGYAQVGSDLTTASLSFDDTTLSASTTRFYRVASFDGAQNFSGQSTIVSATTLPTAPSTGLSFPLHTTGYLSVLPGVGGYGMNTPAGSGRHLTTPATTVILVNSLDTGNTGAAVTGMGANVFAGTWEYAWRHSASPKVIVPIISGWVVAQASIPCQTGTPPRPGYVSYYGQFAPGAGLYLRGANVASNGASNMLVWHLRSYMGDDVAGLGAGNRDCFSSGYGAGTTQSVVLINCEFAWSVDELADFNRGHSQVTFANCAFIEPLHRSTVVHPEDGPGVDHGFAPIVGGDTGNPVQTALVSCFRNVFAHSTGRNPLISAQTFVHANNLHYNHGRPTGGAGNGVQIIAAGATLPNYANLMGNAFIRGPNNDASLVAISVSGTFPAGSGGYSFANSQFGWSGVSSQNSFFTQSPAGYIAAGVQTDAYPSSWGANGVLLWAANPLSPTAAEWSAFVELMDDTVGAQPARRTSGRVKLVFDQIRDRLNGVTQTNQFVDTVTQAGGWFSVPSATVDPLNPGTEWHAPLPTGSDRDTPYTSGTFSDGKSKVGYTRLDEWAYEQHLYVTTQVQVPVTPGLYYAGPVLGNLVPTVYAAPTARGTGSGTSEANAMAYSTWQNATGNKPAGTVLGLLPGVYTMPAGGERFEPAFRTRAAGTASNPIRIVAKYSAIDLAGKQANQRWTTADLDTVFAHANRTEFRHNGTWTEPNGGSTTGPSFGCGLNANENYNEWYGICAQQQFNIPHRDTGTAVIVTATGSSINRCVLRGNDAPYTALAYDNNPGLRIESSTNPSASDNVIYGYYQSIGGQGATHNHCGIQRYKCTGLRLRHNQTFGNWMGIFLKDEPSTSSDEIVEFNLCQDSIEVAHCNETTPSVFSYVRQNLIVAPSLRGIDGQNGDARNVNIWNNTIVASCAGPDAGTGFLGHYWGTGTNFQNNIVYGVNGNLMNDSQFRDYAPIVPSNYNRFYSASGFRARFNDVNYQNANGTTGLQSWRTGTGQDNNSSFGDPLFTNFAGNDFHLQAGSPCRTGGNPAINAVQGCYITGTETIGPRYA